MSEKPDKAATTLVIPSSTLQLDVNPEDWPQGIKAVRYDVKIHSGVFHVYEAIGELVRGHTELRSIHLSGPDYSHDELQPIRQALKDTGCVTKVYIRGYCEGFPLFDAASRLTKLSLLKVGMTGVCMQYLSNCSALRKLDISDNYISGGLSSLSWLVLSSLVELNLTRCGLDAHDIRYLAPVLARGRKSTLRRVVLDGNELSDASIDCIATSLYHTQGLTELSICGQRLSMFASAALIKAMRDNSSIYALVADWEYCALTEELVGRISENSSWYYAGDSCPRLNETLKARSLRNIVPKSVVDDIRRCLAMLGNVSVISEARTALRTTYGGVRAGRLYRILSRVGKVRKYAASVRRILLRHDVRNTSPCLCDSEEYCRALFRSSYPLLSDWAVSACPTLCGILRESVIPVLYPPHPWKHLGKTVDLHFYGGEYVRDVDPAESFVLRNHAEDGRTEPYELPDSFTTCDVMLVMRGTLEDMKSQTVYRQLRCIAIADHLDMPGVIWRLLPALLQDEKAYVCRDDV